MNSIVKRIGMMSALAATLVMWGCDVAQDPMDPQLNPSGMVVMSTDGVPYVVAVEADPTAEVVTAVIGAEGGEISMVGSHKLFVSAGAVDAPTTFTMQRYPEEPLRVKLTAGVDSENDIGAAGFGAPVTLELDYTAASNLPADLSDLELMYFRTDGLVEILETDLDSAAGTLQAHLPHFSLFGLGWGGP